MRLAPTTDRACAMAEGRRWRKEGSVERVAQIKTLTASEKEKKNEIKEEKKRYNQQRNEVEDRMAGKDI